jgi:hypothetical protein
MVNVEIKGHHTVWVKKREWARAVPVRYGVSGDSLVTFGDNRLEALSAGDHAVATVHEIAGGPLIASFGVTVADVAPADVDREALLELVEHVPLGATLAEVNARVDELSRTRRIIVLVP